VRSPFTAANDNKLRQRLRALAHDRGERLMVGH
jgi:hypothetical protein